MDKRVKDYIKQLNELQALIDSDFHYYNGQQSKIDRRLNELGKRGDIEATAAEMESLLAHRKQVKDAALKLLPLRDFFRNNYGEVQERLDRLAQFDYKRS